MFWRASGGLGDVLICAGVLACSGATLAVPDHHVGLICRVRDLDVIPLSRARPEVIRRHDQSGNFDGLFANTERLTDEEYYSAAARRAGTTPRRAVLEIEKSDQRFDYVFHPGSSNPNRQWGKQNWYDLAESLTALGRSVAWLGVDSEWGYSGRGSTKLSDWTSDLVGQAEYLANAGHFVGNDSGFAHVAGILGVPGHVLFFNTHPDQVISRYPGLDPVHKFDVVGPPSRSLNPHDPRSAAAISALTVDDVCSVLGVDPRASSVFTDLPKICIIGNGQRSQFFRNALVGVYDFSSDSSTIVLPDQKRVFIGDREFTFVGGPFDLQRFLIACASKPPT